MPIIEIQLRDGRIVEVDLPRVPSPAEVDRIAREIEAHLGIAPATPAQQPTQAQQLAQAVRGTLQRGWNWLRSRLGLKSPEERAREIAGPKLAQRPEALAEMTKIEAARRQASAVLPMLRDAATAPENLAAEKRYGSALQRRGAQASTGSQMDPIGVVTGLGNLLGLPQRGAVAWAKQVAQRHGARGSKYASGADAFGDAAEWGALLEDLIPQLPKPVRQALSIPMDVVLDPLLAVPPAKVAATLAPIASKLPGAARAGQAKAWIQWQALKALHPTAAATMEQALQQFPLEQLRTGDNLEMMRQALSHADQLAGRSPEDLGAAVYNLLFGNPAAAQRLPGIVFTEARAGASDEAVRELAELARQKRWRDIAARLLGTETAEDLIPPSPVPPAAHIAGMAEAMRRWVSDTQQPSGWQRALGWWKRAVTSFNLPAGWVRNFLGNFIAHYLANEPLRVSPRPLTELLREAFSSTGLTRAGDIGADVLKRGEPPKNAMLRWVAEKLGKTADWAGRTYSSADKLAAAILAKISDKPVEHFMISEQFRLPERIEWLSRVGLIPFATWPTFIIPRLWRGFLENPARWHRLSMALQSLGAEEKGTNLYKPLSGNRALNLEPFLPVSPYMFASSEGDLPELLQRWPPLAFGRDISDALAGAPARPAALSTESPILNALITASNYALPPSFWNALRLAKPEWFADIPRSPLTPSDYLWRLVGLGIIRNPEQYEIIRRRRELEKLRRLMRRVGIRENQMNEYEWVTTK